MLWAVLSVFAFIFCMALINHFYNKNHTEKVVPFEKKEQFIDNTYSVSFESLMSNAEKHHEDSINPIWVSITKDEKVSNPHIATCIAAKKAFRVIEEISKRIDPYTLKAINNPYVTKLIELKEKVQQTPNVLGRHSELHRGIKAKVKCFYDDFTPTEELEVLLTKDKVDFAHKDWYSV